MLDRAVFALSAGVVTSHVLLLVHAAWRSGCNDHARSDDSERKFRAFKRCRTAIGSVQLVGQLAATAVALAAAGGASAQQHAQLQWWGAGTEALVLLAHAITLAVLVSTWRWQFCLELRGVFLLGLLEPGLLLSADVAAVQEAGGVFAPQRLARLLLHSSQLVLLVGLLVGEVIVRGALTCSGSSPAGLAALARGGTSTGYMPLPGSDLEAGAAKPAQQQRSASKRPVLWRPGDGRWRMAGAAFHYVWPRSRGLKLQLAACFALVLAERGLNLAAPLAFKHMVETFAGSSEAPPSTGEPAAAAAAHAGASGRLLLVAAQLQQQLVRVLGGGSAGAAALSGSPSWLLFWPWVALYLAAFFLRGGSGSEGLLANVRDMLWIPITQAAFRRISSDVFGHLLELDHTFHLHRKTGMLLRILDRGTSSIQDTVSIMLFNVLPQLLDVLVAVAYLAAAMQPWVGGVVAATVAAYVPLTLLITERRGAVRKVMNALDGAREARVTDMLLNYEAVKLATAEDYELGRFVDATRQYQAAEYWQLVFVSLLSMVQSSVVWMGLAGGLVVCTVGAAHGQLSVGDTVLFISLMTQLYVPLTYFGSYYRQVSKALVDMENMFELLARAPGVTDAPGAAPLRVSAGRVDFQQVVFSYSPGGSPVLRGVSFTAPGGRTLAVVGSTGSGKSTLLRLLLRFFDPTAGAVLLDGQDLRAATQASVRAAMAVVPQDSVLFNDTIGYNIAYGRPGASEQQVHEAAEIAHIHQHISAFPKGYGTRVGERGLRLSGGEKQRVALARALLKNPPLLVLDEATSALDSLTERLIQDSLARIRGRCTQIIVAHRLSTIMDADQIVVLDKGLVAEQGTHAQLVEAGGLYFSMWARQQDALMSGSTGLSRSGSERAAAASEASDNEDITTDPSSRQAAGAEQQQQVQVTRGNEDEGGDDEDADDWRARQRRAAHLGTSSSVLPSRDPSRRNSYS